MKAHRRCWSLLIAVACLITHLGLTSLARAAADDKDVLLAGGASIIQQYLNAGLLDELQIHIAPVLLGDGTSLFDRLGIESVGLEATRVIASPSVTHLRFRVPATTA